MRKDAVFTARAAVVIIETARNAISLVTTVLCIGVCIIHKGVFMIFRSLAISRNEVVIVAVLVVGSILVPELSNNFEFFVGLWKGKWIMIKYSFQI